MQGNKKVLEVLNDLLADELTAINQYVVHGEMAENWGYGKLKKLVGGRAITEMKHAEKLIERILFLEGFPNLQTLDQLRIGETVKEVIECDLKAEIEARSLYQEAAKYCREVGDFPSEDLFKALMKDEEGHIDFLETQLDLIARVGIELYTQKHIGGLEGDDHGH